MNISSADAPKTTGKRPRAWAGCVLAVLTLAIARPALAQQELFFTYIGATLGGGTASIDYNEWVVDERKSQNASGVYFSGGLLLDVVVRDIIGEFTMQAINTGASEDTVASLRLLYSVTGKYAFRLSDSFFLCPGIGLYLESGPSDKSYQGGAGLSASAGLGWVFSRDWILLFDLVGRYGSYGLGEESTIMSYGASLGVVYKIGRL
ncbi:MAG TPA: hypothetical protein PKO25_12655 [Spirochaetota bacterium]|nr:hypothetical protein [Spirochaetota bacterium]OPZ38918.1 MAG: hypothetical protein BWY96_00701 [Spirochaetes bacterium ADurb.BinA120]HNU92714.1 hypothetical protein [Spirochaetota bacterium]HPI13455.1 hypothetical protein [Spirochaetota bacterium]HPV97377.1 hypothetical protein [Spirochaetota bacterium]